MGYAGALRDYVLAKPESRNKALANPMAAKLGTGLGSYDDMQNWAGWLQEDWQAGINKKDATAGGSLYSTLDTRFPNRLLLSYAALQPDKTYSENFASQPGNVHPFTEITVDNAGAVKMISQKLKSYGGYSETLLIYLKNEGKSVTIESYADSGGKPTGSAIQQATITTNDYGNGVGYSVYAVVIDPNLAAGTAYHVVLYPTNSDEAIHIPACETIGGTNIFFAAWAGLSATSLMVGNVNQKAFGGQSRGVIFNQIYYFACGDSLVKFASGTFTNVNTFANTITDLLVAGDTLYIGQGNAAVFSTMNVSETITPDGALMAERFALFNGFVWRSLTHFVYYTGDGVTWTEVDVAYPGETIYSLAGAGDYLYVATDQNLYYVGAGDQALTLTPWPNLGYQPRLIGYQGALYAGFGESLVKYEGGTVLPMGLDLGEGLPVIRDGYVVAMATSNYWLYVGIVGNTANARSTIWAWNGQGWHHICTLPGANTNENGAAAYSLCDLCYDRYTNTLWAFDGSNPLQINTPDTANYSTDTVTITYAPHGWLESDWFYGSLYEIYKDVESVYVSADVCDSDRYVEIYWKDDASTAWELLGTCTATRTELRWSDPATRPNSRQIKLGIALYSKTANSTPVVRAIRLKYMAMVNDRYRWNMPIEVSDNQQMPLGGGINPFNAYQQRAHLDTLIRSVPPFILQDVDGAQYEVKVLSASEGISKWEPVDGAPNFTQVFNLTIEQCTTGQYTG